MKVAVIQFPGSNCDWDAYHAFHSVLDVETRIVWHKDVSLGDATAVVVPGGFSFGDYLRCGAIAQFSPIMAEIKRFAEAGGPVIGICNGFQILCEAGLLPGALVRNRDLEFICETLPLKVEDSTDFFNKKNLGELVTVPIAHGEGNYRIDDEGLKALEENGQILFRYASVDGSVTNASNPNGSINNIAGIRNAAGNVFGMMPHPERAMERIHPSQNGVCILKAFLQSAAVIA